MPHDSRPYYPTLYTCIHPDRVPLLWLILRQLQPDPIAPTSHSHLISTTPPPLPRYIPTPTLTTLPTKPQLSLTSPHLSTGFLRAALFRRPDRVPLCGSSGVLCCSPRPQLPQQRRSRSNLLWSRIQLGLLGECRVHENL